MQKYVPYVPDEYLPCFYKSETVEKFADIFAETARKLLKAMRENKCDSEVFKKLIFKKCYNSKKLFERD